MSESDLRELSTSHLQVDNVRDRSIAFVTPTFWRDVARCELLAESLDRCAPEPPHYLIVDRRDRSTFAHLERGRRRIIESEELIDGDFWRLPGGAGWWLNYRTPPVRGWIMQQIKKIASIRLIPEDMLVFCDSDAAFFQRFSNENLLLDDKVGLLDIGFVNDDIRLWTKSAQKLLGITEKRVEFRNYVGYLVCWDRRIVGALQKRIELVHGTRWQISLARTMKFSEYMLYGAFVSDVLGYENTIHKPSDIPLIKARWAAKGESNLGDFFHEMDPRTIGIMVHSKDGVDPQQVRWLLEKRWPET